MKSVTEEICGRPDNLGRAGAGSGVRLPFRFPNALSPAIYDNQPI
jgi:hypothetical protein